MLINYNHVYIGASLAVLIKCLFERKKTLIIEKSNYLGGAWSSSNNKYKNLDLACHLLVSPSIEKSNLIIKQLKKFKINLRKINKDEFYSDTKKWKSYGKRGPALICEEGWADMLNKVIFNLKKKRNITIIKNQEVKKIEINTEGICKIILDKKKIFTNKVFLPTYVSLKSISYNESKILIPNKKIKSIHFIIEVLSEKLLKKRNFQGFYYKNSIFDRLSVSKITNRKNYTHSFFSARVSKNFKSKINLISNEKIKKFLINNHILKSIKKLAFEPVYYKAYYRGINERQIALNSLNKIKHSVKFLNTFYFGHFLAKEFREKKNKSFKSNK